MRYWEPRKFKLKHTVGIGVASYLNDDPRRLDSLACLLYSLRAQTFQDFSVLIVHDGPLLPHVETSVKNLMLLLDSRFRFVATEERKAKFGHPNRQLAIDTLANNAWLLLTNDDNYYVPVFLEDMLSTGDSERVHFVHCDMVHSHQHWQPFRTKPKYRHLDLGGFIVRSAIARTVPFDCHEFNGDGDWIDRLVARVTKVSKGTGGVRHLKHIYFVHN